jgi:uncharacterized protein YjbJ (UPF0337 family)
MNENQVKGTAKDIAGKVQQKVGEATGSTEQQIKGGAKQVEGNVQKGIGNVQEDVKRTSDDVRDQQRSDAQREQNPSRH